MEYRNRIISQLALNGFVDSFRYLNPDSAGLTFRPSRERDPVSRLDYVFVSQSFLHSLTDCKVIWLTDSDHALVHCVLQLCTGINERHNARYIPNLAQSPEDTKQLFANLVNKWLTTTPSPDQLSDHKAIAALRGLMHLAAVETKARGR